MTETKPEVVFACQAHALDKTQRQRQQALLGLMKLKAQSLESRADGLLIRLPADAALFQEAAEWVSLERRCCPFLDFALTWGRDDVVTVKLSGPEGVKAFLDGVIQ